MRHAHDIPDVLIVDSRPMLRTMLRTVLMLAGFHVRCASGGVAALAAIRYDAPDVILLDTGGSEIDGVHLCAALSDDAETHEIPILSLSSSKDSPAQRLAHRLGVNAFVTPPYDEERLRDEILRQIDWDS